MSRIHSAALALSAALAFFVGGWAFFAPRSFYDAFPGVLGQWISTDGPFNEHLIRDVGAFYLALGVASVAGLVWRSPAATRILGLAWTVFGALHLGYHVAHLDHLDVANAVGSIVSLALSLALGIVLLIPGRGAAAGPAADGRAGEGRAAEDGAGEGGAAEGRAAEGRTRKGGAAEDGAAVGIADVATKTDTALPVTHPAAAASATSDAARTGADSTEATR